MYSISLIIASVIAVVGVGCRLRRTFRKPQWSISSNRPPLSPEASPSQNIRNPTLGHRLTAIGKTVLLDGLLMSRTWQTDRYGWAMHVLLCWGFLLLMLMHGFDSILTRKLFPGYEPTLNPYLFLRNGFGVMAVVGLAMAAGRRLCHRGWRPLNRPGDWLPLILIGIVMVSGFFLESVKIASGPIFHEMVADYLGSDDPGDVAAISALWQKEHGVVFDPPVMDKDSAVLVTGRTLNEESCQVCHSKPQSAFVSYAVARTIGSAGRHLNRRRMDLILWHVHYLSCFALLALAPFGKLYHLISTPVTLWMRRTESPVNRLPSAWMDGCTHCGICSRQCSVAPVHRILGMREILPSEKLMALRSHDRWLRPDAESLRALAHGNAICTRCYRCTRQCPSGIDLQHLWSHTAQLLSGMGLPETPGGTPETMDSRWTDSIPDTRPPPRDPPEAMPRYPLLDAPRTQLFHCVQCSTCSGVCPVVAAAGAGEIELDITPQQVMNLLRLGLRDLALGSTMVWECATCYQCQERCPQGIAVADILYELRNDAWFRMTSLSGANKPV